MVVESTLPRAWFRTYVPAAMMDDTPMFRAYVLDCIRRDLPESDRDQVNYGDVLVNDVTEFAWLFRQLPPGELRWIAGAWPPPPAPAGAHLRMPGGATISCRPVYLGGTSWGLLPEEPVTAATPLGIGVGTVPPGCLVYLPFEVLAGPPATVWEGRGV